MINNPIDYHSNLVDYQLVRSETPGGLTEQVQLLIGKGYRPYGNPFSKDKWFLQAMTTNWPTAPIDLDSHE